MSTALRSSSSANTGASVGSSVSLPIPSPAPVVGDLLLAAISTDSTTTVNTPAGWTFVKGVSQSTGSTSRLSVFSLQVTGYETWPIVFSLNSGSKMMAGVLLVYSGTSGFPPAISGANTVSAASTSIATQGTSNTWSGMSVAFWGTRNTTGACTITAAAGWNGSSASPARPDTCTTATPFIEAEAQDITVALPVTLTNAATSTASQSATGESIVVAIDDIHMNVPLCIDDVFKTTFTTNQTTTNVTIGTNYPNELLIACVAIETGVLSSVSTIAGTGITFTKLNTITTQSGDCEVWYALVPTLQTSNTITVTYSAGNPAPAGSVTIFGISGVDITSGTGSSAFGSIATGNNVGGVSNGTATATLTTTSSNSRVFAIANSATTNKLSTGGAGAGQTVLGSHATSTTSSSFVIMQNSATAASGASVTMSSGSSSVTNWNLLAFEILATNPHSLSAGGVGI